MRKFLETEKIFVCFWFLRKMDRYQRVEKPRAETPIDENEIRITSQGRMRSYISYAMSLLQVRLSIHFFFLLFSGWLLFSFFSWKVSLFLCGLFMCSGRNAWS